MKYLLLLFLTMLFYSCTQNFSEEERTISGPYLGQTPPGDNPELFAPGIVSDGMYNRDLTMTPDGKEIYFCVSIGSYTYSTILVTKEINGIWTEPEVMEYMEDPEVMNIEPAISPDGSKFFFLSNRIDSIAGDTAIGDSDIWVMDRLGDKWSEPYNIGAPINSDAPEFFPSVTRTGTMYFTRADKVTRDEFIYRSKLVDSQYQEPELLPEQVNLGRARFNAFIAPDESYLIVPSFGREDSYGGTDYYIVFRNEDDTWNEPINMGEKVNSENGHEWSASLSPDGKYLFFMSDRKSIEKPTKLTYNFLKKAHISPQNGNADIYWISTSIIEEKRQKIVESE